MPPAILRSNHVYHNIEGWSCRSHASLVRMSQHQYCPSWQVSALIAHRVSPSSILPRSKSLT